MKHNLTYIVYIESKLILASVKKYILIFEKRLTKVANLLIFSAY